MAEKMEAYLTSKSMLYMAWPAFITGYEENERDTTGWVVRSSPAGTGRRTDVDATSMQRHFVAQTSVRRRYDILCLLGGYNRGLF